MQVKIYCKMYLESVEVCKNTYYNALVSVPLKLQKETEKFKAEIKR